MQVEKLKTIDADTLLSTPIRKTLFVVDDLIPQGLSVLSGSSKIGKSWLMLWLGIQVARGQPVWEFETYKSDVLYLCLEDTYARIQSRLYKITDEAPPELRIATTSFQIGNGLEQQIEQYLSDFPKTKLVIIDTFQKVRDSKSTGGKSGMYAEELQHLFEVVKGTKLELPVLVAAFYGLRRGEVCGLKWDAIDFERGTITIRHTVTSLQVDGKTKMYAQDSAKTKSSMRTLPLVGSFAEYFKEVKAAQEVNKKVCGNCYNYEYDGYVFVDELGDLMRPEYLTSYFPQYIQKHGCKRMRFHDLRHSCASLLLANGVPLKQIQEWLGHSDFSTTANIYAHLDYTSKLSSAKAMVSGMALPESVNFGSKWIEISDDDGKN